MSLVYTILCSRTLMIFFCVTTASLNCSSLHQSMMEQKISSPSFRGTEPLMCADFKTGAYAILAKSAYDAFHDDEKSIEHARKAILDIESKAIATTIDICLKRSAECPAEAMIETMTTDLSRLLVAIDKNERWLNRSKATPSEAPSSNPRLTSLTEAIQERSELCESLAIEPIMPAQGLLRHPLIIELRNKEANASMGQLQKALKYYNLECMEQRQQYQTIECGLSTWKNLTRVTIPKTFLISFERYTAKQKIGSLYAQLLVHELLSSIHAADETLSTKPLNGDDVRKINQLLTTHLPKPRHLPIALAHSKKLCGEASAKITDEALTIPEIALCRNMLHETLKQFRGVCIQHAHPAIDSSDLLLVRSNYEKHIHEIESFYTRPVFEKILEETPYAFWPSIAHSFNTYKKGIDYCYIYWIHSALQNIMQQDTVSISLSDHEIATLFIDESILSTSASHIDLPDSTSWALLLGDKAHSLEDNARKLLEHILAIKQQAQNLADISYLESSSSASAERITYKEQVLNNKEMHACAETVKSELIATLMPLIASTPESELIEQPALLAAKIIQLLGTYHEYTGWYYKLMCNHGVHEKKEIFSAQQISAGNNTEHDEKIEKSE